MDDDNPIERTIGDWTAYQDEDGGTYYHNATTGESSWDAPPGFEDDAAKPDHDGFDRDAAGDVGVDVDNASGEEVGIAQTPPLDGDGNDYVTHSPAGAVGDAADLGGDEKSNDGVAQSPPHAAVVEEGETEDNDAADGEDIGNGWVAYKDEEGNVYYCNADTGETQWDRPDVAGGGGETADLAEETNATTPDSSPRQKSPPVDRGHSPDKKDWPEDDAEDNKVDIEPAPEEEPENTVETAEQFLQSPDAVMEPNVWNHIDILVQNLGAQVAGPKAMQSLMNGYGGDTAVCGLMGLWLAELKSMGGSRSSRRTVGNNGGSAVALLNGDATDDQRLFHTGANVARDVVEEVVNRLAKERFTKDGGDAIVKLSKKDAAFIDKMIKSERWRKLLIDLSATTANKDSKLFMYCLQSISNLGHHREIANRINQSDYFGVFNSMLQSELSIAARIAVDGYTKEVSLCMDTSKGSGPMMMGSLIADLRRTCTSTSYTYLYAMEVLKLILSKSKKMLSEDGEEGNHHHPFESSSLKRAMRKWERLREELEDEMLTPIKTGTSFQRKRRIDVALTMSDLFQRKRRRMDPGVEDASNNVDSYDSGSNVSSSNDLADALDAALSQLLTKNSLGVQIDKEVADNILKFAYGGSTDRIGDLLIQHPTAITALLHNLFGSKRIRQLETRLKCARLVALAVTASERRAMDEFSSSEEGENVTESCTDEDNLSQVILKGSQLCEQIENMVSFTVLDDVENDTSGSSVGRQLCVMCIQHSAVAQGVLTWAKEFANKSDFVTMVSYPTISPCILSLARLICRHHPLTRPAVLDISLMFMGHSNREISHQKMSSIKEQCLRLLLWLTTQGLSLAVISAVQNKLEKGSSEMDSALVRYFFTGILEIVRPPLSMPFVRAMGRLMAKTPFVDALRSKHFEDSKRGRINQLIGQFEATAHGKFQKVVSWEEDAMLLKKLKSTYGAFNGR